MFISIYFDRQLFIVTNQKPKYKKFSGVTKLFEKSM